MIGAGLAQVYAYLTFVLVLYLALKYASNKSECLKDYQNLGKIFCKVFFFLLIPTIIIIQPEVLEESQCFHLKIIGILVLKLLMQ